MRHKVLLTVVFLALLGTSVSETPGSQREPEFKLIAGQVRSDAKGLDSCQAPSHSQMAAFWSGSNWYWWGIYIGGSNMGCPNNNVSEAWIDQEINRGWRILPIWVGPQAPCTNYGDTFPTNISDAYDRGYNAASKAFSRAVTDLGMNLVDLPIVYDLEAFDTSNTACLNAAKAFMRGWTTYLHAGTAQKSGLYGSVCGSGLDSFWPVTPNPDFVWAAYYNDNPDTGNLACVASSHWQNVRHKQYTDNVNRTENGVTLLVDINCSRGPVYGDKDTSADPACQ